MTSCFQDTRLLKIGNTLNDRLILNIYQLKISAYIMYLSLRSKVSSGLLYDKPFSRYKVAENRQFWKCTQWPRTDFDIWIVKSTSYTPLIKVSTPDAQIWVCFALRPAVFEIQSCPKLAKSEMHRMTSNDIEHLTVKSTFHTLGNYPNAQILVRFALRPAFFQIQGCQKREIWEMLRMTSDWLNNWR